MNAPTRQGIILDDGMSKWEKIKQYARAASYMDNMDIDNQRMFEEIANLLAAGREVTVNVRGRSMEPLLVEGRDRVTLRRCGEGDIRLGDIVLARQRGQGRVLLHRVVKRGGDSLTLQGDAHGVQTETVSAAEVAGVVVSYVRQGRVCHTRRLSWRLRSLWRVAFLYVRRLIALSRINAGYLRRASRGFRWRMALNALVGIVSIGFTLAFIYGSKHAIDVATGITEGALWRDIVALAVLVALQLAAGGAVTWISTGLRVELGNALRGRVFANVLSSRWAELSRFHTGDVVNRVERDTASLATMLSITIPSFVVSAVQFVLALAFFCFLDPWLPWLVMGVFPLLLLCGKFYVGKMYRYTHLIRQSDSLVQSTIQESLQQRVVVKALELDDSRVGMLRDQQTALRGQLMERTRFSIFSRAFVSAAFATGYLAVFAWGVIRLSEGGITFGTMAAFLQLVGKIQTPILDMARLLPALVEVLASVDRLRELERLAAEGERGRVFFSRVPDVVLRNVSFAYPDGARPVLSGFTCAIPAGSSVAVMGVTGRGKTTLLRLLLAFVQPSAGSVSLVCGGESRVVSAKTRCNFTYVPQGNTLFSGSVRDNLLLANPLATEEEMRQALSVAEAGFVYGLPHGIDTRLGEQGGGLSEGQAQRVAVARALLRPGHILLFDEATSALDVDTESRLVANLKREFPGKTFIFVTHHEAIARVCDQVLRL